MLPADVYAKLIVMMNDLNHTIILVATAAQ